jgi:nucleoid-associated protein YgaU
MGEGKGGGEPRGDLGETIVVKNGDTLTKLARKIYGRSDDEILDLILKHNPGIRNPDLIRRGQKLIFPPLPEIAE